MSSDSGNEEETDRAGNQQNRWPSIISSLLNSSRPQNDKSEEDEEATAGKIDEELSW